MILVFEMVWTGTHHAPGNSVTIQTIARAFPGQRVLVHAESTHLRELTADEALTGQGNIAFQEITLSEAYRFRPQIVSASRAWREFRTMRAALAKVPPGEPVLIMLLSVTSTAIFAAALLARLSRRPIGVHAGLHGNLNDALAWRPRNPLARAFDMPAAMASSHGGKLRFLVLEHAIRAAMQGRLVKAVPRTDVLPLPVNQREIALWRKVPFAYPLRIGLVGQATEAKGITPFLMLAERFRQSHPGKVTFHLVGRAQSGTDLRRFAPLADEVQDRHLTREEFQERLSSLHYVCLPLAPGYYDLSASGALVDAITWLKPVIATPLPIVRDLFTRHGEIGYLCDGVEAIGTTIEEILRDMDEQRYQRQSDTMRDVRDARMPERLAKDYASIVRSSFALFSGQVS